MIEKPEIPDKILTVSGKEKSESFRFDIPDQIWPLGDRTEAIDEACEEIALYGVFSLNQAMTEGVEWNPLVFLAGVLNTEIYVDVPPGAEEVFEAMCGTESSYDKRWEVFCLIIARLKAESIAEVGKEVEPFVRPDGTTLATIIGDWQPGPVLAESLAALLQWYLEASLDKDADIQEIRDQMREMIVESREDEENEYLDEDEDEDEDTDDEDYEDA